VARASEGGSKRGRGGGKRTGRGGEKGEEITEADGTSKRVQTKDAKGPYGKTIRGMLCAENEDRWEG